jgi:hypothetical protein
MKRIGLPSVLVFVLLALAPRLASAQCAGVMSPSGTVCVTPRSPGADNFASAVSGGTMTADQLAQQLAAQVEGLFQTANINSFLHDFQNAQNFSSKGLGVDYASEATLAEVGATFSLASNVDKAYKPSGSSTDPPIQGGGMNLSLMAGIGMGLVGFDPLMFFGNWFKGSGSFGKLDGSYHNWGLHGQIRLFGPSRKMSAIKMLVRWGGIAVTSGVDYSSVSLSTSKEVSSKLDNLFPGAPVTVTSVGALAFTLKQTTWSVPLEVTTSLRLLSLVTVYGGIGFDWQLGGGSELNIAMNAALSGQYPGAAAQDLGTATITASGKVSPSPARMRELAGIQLGILDIVRLFVQVNVANASPMLMSLAGGLRLAY